LCWLQLPALLRKATPKLPVLKDATRITCSIEELPALLREAGFEYQRFLDLLFATPKAKGESAELAESDSAPQEAMTPDDTPSSPSNAC
jgi:hypothetical protein